jgi:hypothetical protein
VKLEQPSVPSAGFIRAELLRKPCLEGLAQSAEEVDRS